MRRSLDKTVFIVISLLSYVNSHSLHPISSAMLEASNLNYFSSSRLASFNERGKLKPKLLEGRNNIQPPLAIPLPMDLLNGVQRDNLGRKIAHKPDQLLSKQNHHPQSGHKGQSSHGHKSKHNPKGHKKVEVDSTLDDLLEVLGPHLFLIPFVAKALPFAIPAVPLTYILTRYEPATISEIMERLQEFIERIRETLMVQMGEHETSGR